MTKQKSEIDNLPEHYRVLFQELDEEDKELVLKYLPKFNAHRDFANLVELGIDVAARREKVDAEFAEMTPAERQKAGPPRIVRTLSSILGIPDSTIMHVTRSVELFGGEYMQQLAVDAQTQGIKLTYSHIRELNRLGTDYVDERQAIVNQIFDPKLTISHRDVKRAVDTILGVKRTVVHYVDADDDDDAAEDKAFNKAGKKAKKTGDALGELATASDIEHLCVQVVDLVSNAMKKLEPVGINIAEWRKDVSPETLSTMGLESLDRACSEAHSLASLAQDISNDLQEAMDAANAQLAEY